jgi:IS605 OrfB family transposase
MVVKQAQEGKTMTNQGGVAGSLQQGRISTPVGEQASGHDGTSVEASPEALAKPGTSGSSSAGPLLTARECGNDPTTPSRSVTEIVRATGRFEVLFFGNAGETKGERDARKFIERALQDAQYQAAQVANTVTQTLWAADSAAYTAWLTDHEGQLPRSKDWPLPAINAYKIGRAVAPTLNTGIVSAVARAAARKYAQARWDVFVRQERAAPHYKKTAAFPLRAQEVEILPEPFRIRFTLRAGAGYRLELPLEPRDLYQRGLLERISSGAWRHGDVMVQRDERRPWKWYFKIAYRRRVERRRDGKAAAINLGIKCFLVGLVEGGETWIYDGNDIVAFLAQVQRRRREYQHDSKASLRRGHGRARTLKPLDHLRGVGERWRTEKCRAIAARFVDWIAKRGVSRLYISDLTGVREAESEVIKQGSFLWKRIQEWPYYRLQQQITSRCEEAGIEIITQNPAYNSKTCPKCGEEATRDSRTWRLSCSACGYKRHLDVAFCENALRRGEHRGKG